MTPLYESVYSPPSVSSDYGSCVRQAKGNFVLYFSKSRHKSPSAKRYICRGLGFRAKGQLQFVSKACVEEPFWATLHPVYVLA